MDATFKALLERISTLEEKIRLDSKGSEPSISEPKIKLPEKFGGNPKEFRGFMIQMELAFLMKPKAYKEDAIKVGTIASLLKDKALAWVTPFLENPNRYKEVLNDYAEFKKLLQLTFGSHDQALLSATKIGSLRQGKRPLTAYAADFRELAADLDWNDSALIHQFRRGLNEDIKNLMINSATPAKLDDFISLAAQCDNRLYEHRLELRIDARPSKLPPFTPFVSQVSRPPGPKPMDIGSISHQKVPREERERRHANGLCFYCGADNHQRPQCPVAPTRSSGYANEPAEMPGNGRLH